jgi:hypothetical protein
MKKDQFQNLSIGTKVVYNGIEYIKIEDERVSCCRVNNAVMSSDPSKKTQINTATEVDVIDE